MGVRKHIPNAITSLNLLCGVIGIFLELKYECVVGHPGLLFMLAAAFFDVCDGLAARLLNTYSPVGKELDSLADVVSFGVLPSIMMKQAAVAEGWQAYLTWIPLLIAVFSALRLAKFNLDERQHEGFLGLPSPASALICGSLCCITGNTWIIISVSVVLCALMVSEIPMFSFKFGKDIHADTATKMLRYAIISISAIIIIIVIAFGLPWPVIILGILTAYVLENFLYYMICPKAS
jgi:CDP-diacylglycerol--serine O-phosphatidyltransferase